MNRYFFALNPDDKTRENIVFTRSQLFRSGLPRSGREVKSENLHLTLLFLGNLTQEQQHKMINEAKRITFPEFELSLNKIGYFKKSQIVWLGTDTIPETLLNLNQQLLMAAKQSELAISQQTYIPHVTLAKKSRTIDKTKIIDNTETIDKTVPLAVDWKVTGFVLFKSIDTPQGVKYQVVESFKSQS